MNPLHRLFKILSSPLIALVRAESPEDQASAHRVISGSILGGAVMFLAKPLAGWLIYSNSNFFATNICNVPGITVPTQLCTITSNILGLLQFLGGVVIIGGLIWGGVKLYRNAKRK